MDAYVMRPNSPEEGVCGVKEMIGKAFVCDPSKIDYAELAKPNPRPEQIVPFLPERERRMFDDRQNYSEPPRPKNDKVWLTIATLGLRALWRYWRNRKA